MSLFPELCQYSIHVNRVPQHDHIHHQPQRAQGSPAVRYCTENEGTPYPAGRPGTVGIVAALVAVMPGVRQYLDDSACIFEEIVA